MTTEAAYVEQAKCADCGGDLILRSGEAPNGDKAASLARGFLGLMVHEECYERYQAKVRELHAERAFEDRVRRSGLPGDLCGLGWDDLIRTGKRARAVDALRIWAEAKWSQARGIYLWGEVGVGKTYLAAVAAYERLRRSDLQWVSVAVLLSRLEGSFSDRDRQQALSVLTGNGPLVLDDIDKSTPSEAKRLQLFAAIDGRVTAGVPLLVTSNSSPAKLAERLGDPIASRLTGYALGRTFELDGPDRRMSLDTDGDAT